jgi:peptide chain release factor 3
VPIITFVNNLDRQGRDPFDLMDEIERALAPRDPGELGDRHGRNFLCTYDLFADPLSLFERGVHNRVTEPISYSGLDDPQPTRLLPAVSFR